MIPSVIIPFHENHWLELHAMFRNTSLIDPLGLLSPALETLAILSAVVRPHINTRPDEAKI
jgi:hypothetical protein